MTGTKGSLLSPFLRRGTFMNELAINLNTKLNIPLYEQIYDYIKGEISSGEIPCGEKLPSSRALAKHLLVSRSTVEMAYEQLLSEGYIETIPCKGVYVSDLEGVYHHETNAQREQKKSTDVKKKYRYDFSPYGIDLRSFPYNTWRKISKEVLSDNETSLFKSGVSQGELELRHAIRDYLHQARGVKCSVEQIVIGAGNEYLLMLLGMILGTEHKIAFENPTYKQAYRVFEKMSYEVTTVDMDKYGMQTDGLKKSGADMAYVMPSHQYPLGIVMPIKRRMELLRWAAECEDRYIIEDDYDSEFRYKGKPIPALQGYDIYGKVIYLGTFSRAIAPAIRVSYMVLPEKLMDVYQKQCEFLSCTVPKLDQAILNKFLVTGCFERHLNKMRTLYKSRHDVLLNNLKPLLGKCTITGENAGVHLLLHFKNGEKESELTSTAAEHNIKVYGLSAYDIEKEEDYGVILLGFANMNEEDLTEATKILCRIWG